jgi:glycerol kinase
MTATHRKGHVCRAALEAAAYQTREVFDAIYADSHVLLKNLRVDGGGTNNKLLMQFQSDVINVPVVKPKVMETTSMGAAFAAGLAVGVWKNVEQIRDLWSVAETFQPLMTEKERTKNWAGWTKAVTKSLDWVQEEEDEKFEDAQEETEVGGDAGEIESIQVTRELMAKAKAPLVQGYSTSSLILMTLCGLGAGIMLGRRQK